MLKEVVRSKKEATWPLGALRLSFKSVSYRESGVVFGLFGIHAPSSRRSSWSMVSFCCKSAWQPLSEGSHFEGNIHCLAPSLLPALPTQCMHLMYGGCGTLTNPFISPSRPFISGLCSAVEFLLLQRWDLDSTGDRTSRYVAFGIYAPTSRS